ncbi:carbonic anhydrase 2 [Osmia lignaria lignaria]|uniref:carbonic anhydrase 2 n=1 Tax=Osmia lignaria lignaria TaxID=1437193 RepID=UPI00402B220B
MTFLIFTIVPLFVSSVLANNFSYDGSNGPSHWGNEYKTCLGKFQSPIDIEEKDVTTTTFPPLQYSGVHRSHTAYMTNNGHTVMIQSFDNELPTISGGPLNGSYVFQQLHFHWGQNDNLGSEDLINNHSFSMELHAVFWKKEYGSSNKAMNHSDGLTVLAYLYQVADKPNPIFDPIVPQIPEIMTVGNNITLKDDNILSKLIAADIESAQNYFTYRGSLTTPPCLEIVQWIDFIKPQFISHEQLAAFRSVQSSDGTNLTHNFRPVQPLDGRVVYRNIPSGSTDTSVSTNPTLAPETTTTPPVTTTTSKPEPTTKAPNPEPTTKAPNPEPTTKASKPETTTPPIATTIPSSNKTDSSNNGQQSMWTVSPFAVILGLIFLLPCQ